MATNIPLTILSQSSADTRGKIHLDTDSTVFMRGNTGSNYVCGKCGSVLLEKVERLMTANAALRCNQCGVYNNLEKPSVFVRKPITIDDLGDLPSPSNSYHKNTLWTEHKHSGLFEELHSKFLRDWEQLQGERPKKLYHYTRFAGLEGILQTGVMWLTDIAYLNDASEMQLAINLVEDCFSEQRATADDIGKELLRRASVSTSPNDASTGFYVACFCKNGDLLSQWRAYGAGGGGYSIGFNATEFGGVAQTLVRKVIYGKEAQRHLLSQLVDSTLAQLKNISNGKTSEQLDAEKILPAFSSFLSDHIREFLYAFKHSAFAEEDEWRVIFNFHRHEHLSALRVREANRFPVPYIECPLSILEEGMPSLPLIEIVHGPTLHPDLTKKSLLLLLERENYDFVEVRGSDAPLRA